MPDRSPDRPVLLAVSSGGGNWAQMRRLSGAFSGADVHYATTDAMAASGIDRARIHLFSEVLSDSPGRLLAVLARMAWIVLRVRPDVIVSTGGVGGLFAIRLGRLIGARTLFIDSIVNARSLSVSARLSLGIADRVLSQWPGVAEHTGAEYRGAIL
jgi:hypothetical protein